MIDDNKKQFFITRNRITQYLNILHNESKKTDCNCYINMLFRGGNVESFYKEYVENINKGISQLKKFLKQCEPNDIDLFSSIYIEISWHYELIAREADSVFGAYSKAYNDSIGQSIQWLKRAWNSFSDIRAVACLARIIITGIWLPCAKDTKEIINLLDAGLQLAKSDDDKQVIYHALAKVYRNRSNYIKAKDYYEKGRQYGLECKSEIQAIDLALGIATSEDNAMQRFIDGIDDSEDLLDSVEAKLKTEFGVCWGKLQEGTQKCLITGVISYVLLYKNINKRNISVLDYSSVIMPVMKACEIEFGKIFFDSFVKWLKEHCIPPETFNPWRCGFVEYQAKLEDFEYIDSKEGYDFFKVESKKNIIQYVSNDRNGVFGLGKLWYWITDYKKQTSNDTVSINPKVIDYLDDVFFDNFFGNERRQEIEVYVLELAQKLSFLARELRNPAAHNNTMPFWKATYCFNVVILVDKILQSFISKIKA